MWLWQHLMIENQIQTASKTGFYWKVCENKWVFNCDLNQKTTVQQRASRYHLSNSSRPIRDGYSSVDTASDWKAGRNNDAGSSHQSGKGSPSSADSLKPILNWTNVCSPEHTSDTSTNYDSFLNWTFSSPNMVRTVQTLLHSQLACNEMQASARTCGRRAADSMIENVG